MFDANINNFTAEKIYRQKSKSHVKRNSMIAQKEEQSIELVTTNMDFSYLISLLHRITFTQVK